MKEKVFPKEVTNSDDAIIILWDDGHRSTYGHRMLRLRCQCASCVDEMSGRPRLDPDRVPQDVRAVDQMQVGNYALQFLWSDTHYTGIYTYLFLMSLCPCVACAARAEGKPGRQSR